ncbi:hypothetical protein [Aliiroseovarius sp.]|uniref:hypothetical protein n=1 Tax=Aliiroseovarius sp. TaxID=1872442 RepID=UPI002607828C|nr:hypothetical protein [Aliiroseovarius sp.]
MVSTSKILTVSYGTFSCTLEGFDEPFNTMKSIAEYFRDLAADDRYFGAEPPTPDAEMLHRIAEREIQKRVEARVENDEVVLRQADAAAPRIKPAAATLIPGETLLDDEDLAQDAAPAPAVVADPAVAAPAAEPARTPEHAPEAGLVAEAVEDPASDLPADSIAAKLQRIRAVVDRGHDEPDDYAEDQQPLTLDVEAEPEAEAAADPVTETPAPSPAPIPSPAPPMFAETEFADPVASEPAEETGAEAGDIEAEADAEVPDDGKGADALAAVMGTMASATPVEDSYEEDEFEIVEELSEEDDPISSVLAGLATPDSTDERTGERTGDDARNEERDIALGDDLDDDLGDDLSVDLDDSPDAAADPSEEGEAENVFAETEAEEASEAPEPRRPIARVIKVKRTDFEPVASDEDDAAEPESQDNEDSMLSPQDEAELMAELADVERDFADPDAGEGAEDEAQDAAPKGSDQPGFAEGVAVDRILAETNVKMDSSEVSRRRSAIAHLKAAVQATRADKEALEDTPSPDETEAYRDDLAHVVRPRRPDGGAKGVARRLAPLMLVSEQRIDTPAPDQAAPAATVRPRRVTKGNLALEDDLDEAVGEEIPPARPAAKIDARIDFDSFARQKGATGMGELLEAAAAHAVFIEGRPHFSRPQIMKLALAHDPEAGHSREDGLRAFGKLLREGRIRKIKRGQFVLNEATRFHPDEGRESA